MPTLAARRLTEAHRLAQLQIGAFTVRRVTGLGAILDPEDLDGTFEDWLLAVTPIVQAQRLTSAELAAAYMRALRSIELGLDGTFNPQLAGPVDLSRLTTSMLVTGPLSIRSNLARAMPVAQAIDIAQARAGAAAMRHALNGGRDTIVQNVRQDQRAVGWERITSGNACDFCSMLEGRGAVYSEDTADFEAHDGCSCSAAPVYR